MSKVDWNILWNEKELKELKPKHLQALEILYKIMDKDDSIKTICDFGCGSGVLVDFLKSKLDEKKLIGSDNNEYSKNKIENIGIEYYEHNLLEKNKRDDIDVAILTDVLEHFYNPLEVINNLSNIRYLIIVVPNFSYITERISVCKGNVPFQMRPQRGGHFYWMNYITLYNIIKKSSYEVIIEKILFPNKINNYLPFLKFYKNLFATSFGLGLKLK